MSYNTLLLITRLGLYQIALQLWGSKLTAGPSILAASAIAFASASFLAFFAAHCPFQTQVPLELQKLSKLLGRLHSGSTIERMISEL
jgi:hypothetical protein